MWPFDNLIKNIQLSFSKASTDYNQVHKVVKQLEQENANERQTSLVSTGLKRMVTNRYNALMNAPNLFNPAVEGGYWAYYFGFAPSLKQDVNASAQSWAMSLLSVPGYSLTKVINAGATLVGTTPYDIDRLQQAATDKVKYQAQVLAVSTGASMAITKMLKTATNKVDGQWSKVLMRNTTRTWQGLGVMAFLYGLGQLSNAMNEQGAFSTELKVKRDLFLLSHRSQLKSRLLHLSERVQELPRDSLFE